MSYQAACLADFILGLVCGAYIGHQWRKGWFQ